MIQQTFNAVNTTGRCFTQVEYTQLIQGMTEQTIQYGTLMIIVGFALGYLMPKIAAYLKVKYGRPPQ